MFRQIHAQGHRRRARQCRQNAERVIARLRRQHQQRNPQNACRRPSSSRFRRHGFANQPSKHQHHQRLRRTQHRRQSARQAIRRHKQHGLEKADVQKTEQDNHRPFAAPRQPACPRQQQQPGGQHADKRGGERAIWRQEFGGHQVSAAPNQRGERGGKKNGGAACHGVVPEGLGYLT